MKTIKILSVFAVLLTAFAFGTLDRGKLKEMRKEMKAYTKANVLPVIKSERVTFDSKLTESEKQIITQVRAELKSEKEAMKAFHKEMKNLRKSGEEPTDAQKNKMKEMRESKKALIEQIRPIIEAHKDELKAIHEGLKPQKESWKADMDAIRKKYISDEEMERMKEERKSKREERMKNRPEGASEKMDGKGKRGKRHGNKHGVHKLLNPVGFLLLDPNASEMEEIIVEEKAEVNVYPNPVSYLSNIELDLPESGNVRIDLLDRQGNMVKTILNEKKGKGKHKIAVTTSDLPSNVYYYKVTTEGKSETKKFVKE